MLAEIGLIAGRELRALTDFLQRQSVAASVDAFGVCLPSVHREYLRKGGL